MTTVPPSGTARDAWLSSSTPPTGLRCAECHPFRWLSRWPIYLKVNRSEEAVVSLPTDDSRLAAPSAMPSSLGRPLFSTPRTRVDSLTQRNNRLPSCRSTTCYEDTLRRLDGGALPLILIQEADFIVGCAPQMTTTTASSQLASSRLSAAHHRDVLIESQTSSTVEIITWSSWRVHDGFSRRMRTTVAGMASG